MLWARRERRWLAFVVLAKLAVSIAVFVVLSRNAGHDSYQAGIFPDNYDLIASNLLNGLGYRILEAREYFWTDKIIAGMFSIGFIGLAIDTVMNRLNTYLLRWHRGLET